jgi:hypothetical protein
LIVQEVQMPDTHQQIRAKAKSGAVCHDILDFSARVVDSVAGQLWRCRDKRLTCA